MVAKIKILGINRWNINRVASQQKIFLSDKNEVHTRIDQSTINHTL